MQRFKPRRRASRPVVHTSSPLDPVSPFCPASPAGPGVPCNKRDRDCRLKIIILQLIISVKLDTVQKSMLCYFCAHAKTIKTEVITISLYLRTKTQCC